MPGKRRCSDKCYEGFVGKDLEYYGEMKNLVLLGKLQLLDRLLPEDMSGCEVIEEDGKNNSQGEKSYSYLGLLVR